MSTALIWITSALTIFVLILTIISIWVSKHDDTAPVQPDPSSRASGASQQKNNFLPFCETAKIKCDTDDDCKKCAESSEGFEMKCIQIPETNDLNSSIKVCAPASAKLDCNIKYGGVPTWSGWSDVERMEWDCLCNYPEWAETSSCKNLNADVCTGGKLDWDLTKKQSPEGATCTCPTGMELVTVNKKPKCFSPDVKKMYFT